MVGKLQEGNGELILALCVISGGEAPFDAGVETTLLLS